jgi:group I intron endonuclease
MTPRFTIYCHTNRVNGKRYVGQTVYSMEKRWGDHVSSSKFKGRRSLFANAVRKYGADAFDHQLLEVVSTQEEANLAEARWISQFTCLVPNGYNLTLGGGAAGRLHENTKILIGKASRAKWQKMTTEERSASGPAESLRTWWRKMTAEELSTAKSMRGERLRAWWRGMTVEERFAQQRARQNTVSPEQHQATIAKAWETRRAKYGQSGHAMTPEALVERGRKIKEGRRKAKEARAPRLVLINLLRAP